DVALLLEQLGAAGTVTAPVRAVLGGRAGDCIDRRVRVLRGRLIRRRLRRLTHRRSSLSGGSVRRGPRTSLLPLLPLLALRAHRLLPLSALLLRIGVVLGLVQCD